MTVRELAKKKDFQVVGKLRRMKDVLHLSAFTMTCKYYIDEAGNEYWMDKNGKDGCIVTSDGGVL